MSNQDLPSRSLQRVASLPWENLQGVAGQILGSIKAVLHGEPSAKTLKATLRKHPQWSAAQRKIVAEAIFGVALWRRRLAHHLEDDWQNPTRHASEYLSSLLCDVAGISTPQTFFGGLDPQSTRTQTLALRLAQGSVIPAKAGIQKVKVIELPLWTPARRDAATGETETKAGIHPGVFANFYSLPDWVAEVFLRQYREEAGLLADAINLPGPVFVRVNLLRQTTEGLQSALRAEGVESELCQYAPDALRLISEQPNIYGLSSYQRGEFEVQDEGSQLLALLVGASPGEQIVDYCAGAGGKTLALASHMKNTGKIFAFDVDHKRLNRLMLRAKNAGAHCIEVIRDEGALPQSDAVLVDAPCSELGALRRGPEMRWRVSPAGWPELQLAILERASRLVRPGGRLIYATCTLREEENQCVIERFLLKNKNFQKQELPIYSRFYREGFFTSLPHLHETDGFFAAVLLCRDQPGI